MSEKNPAAGYAFRAARDIYRELQTTAARCRDERVKELRLYIAQNENNLTKAREQVAQLPGVIADYQREPRDKDTDRSHQRERKHLCPSFWLRWQDGRQSRHGACE